MLHPLLTKVIHFEFEKQIDLNSDEYLYDYYLFEAQRNEAKLVNSRLRFRNRPVGSNSQPFLLRHAPEGHVWIRSSALGRGWD